MHSCDTIWDLLSAYADDEATPDEAAQVEAHIAECAECARDLAFMQKTAVALAATPDIAPPPGLQQAILAATLYRPTWPERLRAALRPALSPSGMAALGVAGAAAIFAVILLHGPAPSTPNRLIANNLSAPLRKEAKSLPPPSLAPPRAAASKTIPEEKTTSAPLRREMPPIELVSVGSVRRMGKIKPTQVAPSVQHPESPESRHNAVPRANDRKPAALPSNPEIIPLPDEMAETPEMTPEEQRMMADMRTAVMDTKPKESEMPPPPKPAVASSESARIRILTANTPPMSAGSLASLADIRRGARRDNDGPVSSALYKISGRTEMTLNVIKTRF